jgi:hypothetical protein
VSKWLEQGKEKMEMNEIGGAGVKRRKEEVRALFKQREWEKRSWAVGWC